MALPPVLAIVDSGAKVLSNVATMVLGRSVDINISNKTRNITLKNPRTYMNCGRYSSPLLPELSPGSSDSCQFQGSFPFWGVAGVLVYKAESFTLAIHFSNPIDYNKFSMELGLELSPGQACEDSLEDIYERMAHGIYSSSRLDIKFIRVPMGKDHGSALLSNGHVKVMATMSKSVKSFLKVVLEEAGMENPCQGSPQPEK